MNDSDLTMSVLRHGHGPPQVTLTHRPTGLQATYGRWPSQIMNYRRARIELERLVSERRIAA